MIDPCLFSPFWVILISVAPGKIVVLSDKQEEVQSCHGQNSH